MYFPTKDRFLLLVFLVIGSALRDARWSFERQIANRSRKLRTRAFCGEFTKIECTVHRLYMRFTVRSATIHRKVINIHSPPIVIVVSASQTDLATPHAQATRWSLSPDNKSNMLLTHVNVYVVFVVRWRFLCLSENFNVWFFFCFIYAGEYIERIVKICVKSE